MAEILKSEALASIPHGFSTREGLTAEDVLPDGTMVFLEQVHSADAIIVNGEEQVRHKADALVTDKAGLLLAIVTADCAPVLLADAEARVIGAAHAGWRGAHGGVIENTLAAMHSLGARSDRIVAVIGPAIAQQSYEVDKDFRARFEPGTERFFVSGRDDHYHFDLPGYVAHRLREAGTGRIVDMALDTYTDPTRFYSFRRATHRGAPGDGRQISAIGLN